MQFAETLHLFSFRCKSSRNVFGATGVSAHQFSFLIILQALPAVFTINILEVDGNFRALGQKYFLTINTILFSPQSSYFRCHSVKISRIAPAEFVEVFHNQLM